jgi:hypothetical protein
LQFDRIILFPILASSPTIWRCELALFSKAKIASPATRPAAGRERRSGKRVALPIAVRVKVNDREIREGRIRDVNLPGLSVESMQPVQVGDRVSVGFDGYPEVAPAFAITGTVRRVLPGRDPNGSDAMGIEIDRNHTSADALQHYKRVVLHYLRHKPLLEDLNSGYFEARCRSCDWIGRVGRRNPHCSRCGSAEVVPL